MSCPNKNHPSFKLLMEQLGNEALAIYTWKVNGGAFPSTIMPITELNKELGIEGTVSLNEYGELVSRIKEYNDNNNTTHSVEAVPVTPTRYDVYLIPSYLNRTELSEAKSLLDENGIVNNLDASRDGIVGSKQDVLFKRNDPSLFAPEEILPTQESFVGTAVIEDNTIHEGLIIPRSKRYNYKEEEGIKRGGMYLNGIVNVLATTPSSYMTSDNQDEINDIQEKAAREYAEQEGVWFDNPIEHFESVYGEAIAGGKESTVYKDSVRNKVVKVTSTLEYRDLQDFIDSRVLLNTHFPNSSVKIIGFGQDIDANGDSLFYVITEQEFFEGKEATQEQINQEVNRLGLKPTLLLNDRYETDDYIIGDLSTRNVIVDNNGVLRVIDPIMHLNHPVWGRGGKRMSEIKRDTNEGYQATDVLGEAVVEGIAAIELVSGNPEKSSGIKKVIGNIIRNAARRLGISVEEYKDRHKTIYKSQPTTNKEALDFFNLTYQESHNDFSGEAETLNQPNNDLKNVFSNNPKIKMLGLSENNQEHQWIANYLTTTGRGKELLGRAGKTPTYEGIIRLLNEEFKEIGEQIKYGTDYYITDISDIYIDNQIAKAKAEANSYNESMWEDVKRDKQKYISEQQDLQRANLTSIYLYYETAHEYPLAMKLSILDSILGSEFSYDAVKDKVSKRPRTKTTIAPHFTPNSVFMNKVIPHALSSKNIIHDYYYEATNFKGEKIDLSEYKDNIHSQTNRGTWYKFSQETPGDNEKFYRMSSLSSIYPGAWCTGGSQSTADSYLKQGDLYIFYSNEENNPTLQLHISSNNEALEVGGLLQGQGVREQDFQDLDAFENSNTQFNLKDIQEYTRYSKILGKWNREVKEKTTTPTFDDLFTLSASGYAENYVVDSKQKGDDLQIGGRYRIEESEGKYILKNNLDKTIHDSYSEAVSKLKEIHLQETLERNGEGYVYNIIKSRDNSRLTAEEKRTLLNAKKYYKDRTTNLEDFKKSLTKKEYAEIYNVTEDLIIMDDIDTIEKLSTLKEGSIVLTSITFDSTSFSQDLTIPKGVVFNGSVIFRSTTFSKNFTISEGVVFNGSVSFDDVQFSKDFTISEGVVFNGGVYFDRMHFSRDLTISEGVVFNRTVDFNGASFSQDLTIPKGVVFNGDVNFFSTSFSQDFTIPKGFVFNGNVDFNQAKFSQDFTISEGVVFNGDVSFRHASFSQDLTIPKGVVFNGSVIFRSTTFSKNFTISEGVEFNGKANFTGARYPDTYSYRVEGNKLIKEYSDGSIEEHPINTRQPEALQQDNRGVIVRQNGRSLTIFNKNSDITTIIHEKAHEYEEVLTQQEIEVLEKWSGHKKGTVEFSEAFAKGAEKVIYDGTLGNNEVSNIFTKFAEWFKELIKNAIAYFSDINEINQDVLKIYTDMFLENPAQAQVTNNGVLIEGVDGISSYFNQYGNIGLDGLSIFNRVILNIAKRLGISKDKYLKKIAVINTNRQVDSVVESVLHNGLDGRYQYDFSDNTNVEVLYQSEQEIERVLKHVPSLNRQNDGLLIRAISESGILEGISKGSKNNNTEIRREINSLQTELTGLFKNRQGNSERGVELQNRIKELKEKLSQTESDGVTYSKEEVLELLKNKINNIYDTASNTNKYYIQNYSAAYIKAQIKYYREQAFNEEKAQEWEHIRDNRDSNDTQERIEALRNQQKSALMLGLNYIVNANEYSIEFKYLMISNVIKYNINSEGYISGRTPETVGLHNSMSPGVLPSVQDHLNKNPNDNLLEIYQQNRLKGFLDYQDRKQISEKYIVETRPDGYWLKFPQNGSEEVVIDLYKMAKESHMYEAAWCTGGSINTARTHNREGDFYIFVDKEYNTRLAMKYNGQNLSESRGLDIGQGVFEEDLEEANYFYNKYPNGKRFIDTYTFNRLYAKYRNREDLEKDDVEDLIRVFKKGDGSYDFSGSDEKIEDFITLLENNKKTIVEHYGLLEEDVAFEGESYENVKLYIGDISNSSYGLVFPEKIKGSLNLYNLNSAEGLVLPKEVETLQLNSLNSAEGVVLPEKVTDTLNLTGLSSAEGLVLPEKTGTLILNNLNSAKGLVFPKEVEALNLSTLNSAEGVVLPEKVTGTLDLNSLKTAKDLALPKEVKNLYLNSLNSVEGLVFPEKVTGILNLSRLKTAEGLVLPKEVGDLNLNILTSAEGLVFPEKVTGTLDLNSLKTAEGLVLPKEVGTLNLINLNSAEGLVLPKEVETLKLNSLNSAEGLVLPEKVTSTLDLYNLKTAKGLVFPKEVEALNLSRLNSAEGLVFPEKVTGKLNLNSLKTAEGLVLPKEVGTLDLSSLNSAEGLVLPKEVGTLDLNSLKTAKGLVLPEKVETLNLNNLNSAEGLVFPKEVKDLYLGHLNSAEGLVLPEKVDNLSLHSLPSAEGLVLPEKVDNLSLHSLPSAEGLVLPEKVSYLDLSSLKTAKGLVLPKEIGQLGGIGVSKGLKVIRGTKIEGDPINRIDDLPYYIKDAEIIDVLNQDKRAAIIKGENLSVLIFGKNSDVTSPLHEIAHEYERVLTQEEKTKILDWAGHTEWTAETSEAFAKGFEKYLYEAKSPNTEVESIFKRFAEYLKKLIQDAIAYFGSVNELNDNMLEIYSAMVLENPAHASWIKGDKREYKSSSASLPLRGGKKVEYKNASEFSEAINFLSQRFEINVVLKKLNDDTNLSILGSTGPLGNYDAVNNTVNINRDEEIYEGVIVHEFIHGFSRLMQTYNKEAFRGLVDHYYTSLGTDTETLRSLWSIAYDYGNLETIPATLSELPEGRNKDYIYDEIFTRLIEREYNENGSLKDFEKPSSIFYKLFEWVKNFFGVKYNREKEFSKLTTSSSVKDFYNILKKIDNLKVSKEEYIKGTNSHESLYNTYKVLNNRKFEDLSTQEKEEVNRHMNEYNDYLRSLPKLSIPQKNLTDSSRGDELRPSSILSTEQGTLNSFSQTQSSSDVYHQTEEVEDSTSEEVSVDKLLGAFDSGTKVIYGLTNPNQTTFPHEVAHGFFDSAIENNPVVVEATIQWYNSEKGTNYPTIWSNLTREQKREIHEAFANGFVVYLNEGGQTDNPKMNSVFAMFAQWIKDLIDDIKLALGIELNDTMRNVYDQILGLERVIEKQVEVVDQGILEVEGAPVEEADVQEEQVEEETTIGEEAAEEDPIINPYADLSEEDIRAGLLEAEQEYQTAMQELNTLIEGSADEKEIKGIREEIEEIKQMISDYNQALDVKEQTSPHNEIIPGYSIAREKEDEGYAIINIETSEKLGYVDQNEKGEWYYTRSPKTTFKSRKKAVDFIINLKKDDFVEDALEEEDDNTNIERKAIDGSSLSISRPDKEGVSEVIVKGTGEVIATVIVSKGDSQAESKRDINKRIADLQEQDTEIHNEINNLNKEIDSINSQENITAEQQAEIEALKNQIIDKINDLLSESDAIAKEIKDNIELLNNYENVGTTYYHVEDDINYEDKEDFLDLLAEDYNEEHGFRSIKEEKDTDSYHSIQIYDGNNNPANVVAKLTGTDGTNYSYKTIHGDIFVITNQGQEATKEEYEAQEKIAQAEAKYEVGQVVRYQDSETKASIYDTITDVSEPVRSPNGKSVIRYKVSNSPHFVLESSIMETVGEIPEQKTINQIALNSNIRKVINNISGRFNSLYGQEFKIVISHEPFNGLARFHNGNIEVNLSMLEVMEQDGTLVDVIVHEFLHPFIKALSISNKALYDNILNELKESGEYDNIREQIDTTSKDSPYYNATESDIQEEILTRYLSEYISQGFNPDGTINEAAYTHVTERVKSLLGQFISWIKEIIDLITGRKSVVSKDWDTVLSSLNNSNKKDLRDTLGAKGRNLYARIPHFKEALERNTKKSSTDYKQLASKFIHNKPVIDPEVSDTPIPFREWAKRVINNDSIYNEILNSALGRSGYTFKFGTPYNSTVQIEETDEGTIILLDESLKNTGRSFAYIVKQHLKKAAEQGEIPSADYVSLQTIINNAYYSTNSTEGASLSINELNPLMKINELADMLIVGLSQEQMVGTASLIGEKQNRYEEYLKELEKNETRKRKKEIKEVDPVSEERVKFAEGVYSFYSNARVKISFTREEMLAINQLSAYMAVTPSAAKVTRDIVAKRAEQLRKIGDNYRSDTLRYEANRINWLNTPSLTDEQFVERYAEEAVTSLGIAYRKYMEMIKTIRDKSGEISPEEIKRFNKQLIEVRQLVSMHDQFDQLVSAGLGKGTTDHIRYLQASSYITTIKNNMEDAATNLTVEWLLPYAEVHNKYMAEQGYKGEEYEITPELIRNHFKYGYGEDVGYISYWLGSNVTSRNLVNALVANTINQDLMATNLAVHDASMDINVAFRNFLKSKGFGNITSSQSTEFYKENYLRKVKITTREYDDILEGEYKEVETEKWAIHTPFLEDKFAKDLKEFEDSLPEPKNQDEANENQDKIIAWKKSKGLEINPATGRIEKLNSEYINPAYSKLSSDPFFKVLEEYYHKANDKYGHNKLQFGIIPQKFNENAIARFKTLIKDVKVAETNKAKFEEVKKRINQEYGYNTENKDSLNLDDTVFKRLNTTLTTLKNEDTLSLSLHELITDFVGEAYRYSALTNTQYNVENLTMLLEGNENFNVGKRHLSQPDVTFNINAKERYEKAKKEIELLDKAKAAGETIDTDRYDKVKAVVDKGYKAQPIRDKVRGKVIASKEDKANKMLIAQLNHIYFGEDIDDWNIKFLNNASAASIANAIGFYESVIRMGGNVIAAANNVTMGNLHMFIEAHGGKYYDKKTLLKASAQYMGNIHNYFMDTKNPIKTKDAQLAIIWDAIQGEIQNEFGKKVTGSLASKFFRSGSFFFLTAAGEHQIQITNMKAMAMYKKVKTKDGQTISLYDAYVKDENGRYSLRKDIVDFTQEDLFKFMRDLQGVNRMLNGNYSDFNKTMLQRKWYGNLILKFRKWIYTSLRSRWSNERVDYERNTVEVGYYKYFVKYLKDGITNIIKREGGFTKKSDMKPHELYAMRKALLEIGFYLGITILAGVMFGGGDEPTELNEAQKLGLLLMVRLHSDLEFYHGGLPNLILAPVPGVPFDMPNPAKDVMRIITRPASSINTANTFIKVIENLGDPGAVYQQSGPGYKKGENKLWIQGRKLLPMKQFLDLYEGRFQGTVDNQLGYYEMINKGIEGVTARKSTM